MKELGLLPASTFAGLLGELLIGLRAAMQPRDRPPRPNPRRETLRAERLRSYVAGRTQASGGGRGSSVVLTRPRSEPPQRAKGVRTAACGERKPVRCKVEVVEGLLRPKPVSRKLSEDSSSTWTPTGVVAD